jgi:tetratricopeptide (TPR) repeat protein
MAFDKSRTSPFMRFTIGAMAVIFALGIVGVPLIQYFESIGSGQGTPGNANATQTTTETVNAIGAQAAPTIKALEASLTAQPTNYSLLVNQADAYFEWALAVRKALAGTTRTDDQSIWKASSGYFERALKVKPGDPNVMTDYSVTLYYSNQVLQAIVTAEQIVDKNPKFAPIRYNMGLYYRTLGDKANAKKAFEAYLQLEPTGENAASAKDNLTAIAAGK